MTRWILLLCFALVASSCAHTREPIPVQSVQTGDELLTCEQIRDEYCSHVETATAKIAKNVEDDTRDVLLGFFIWPGLADFKNADGIEGNALLDRCIHLRNIGARKGCSVEEFPAPPERYK